MEELKVSIMEEEELKPGTEIPTPAGIRFYPCENCLFNNCEVYLSPDIPDHEAKHFGTIAARAGLERRLRELWNEITSIQNDMTELTPAK